MHGFERTRAARCPDGHESVHQEHFCVQCRKIQGREQPWLRALISVDTIAEKLQYSGCLNDLTLNPAVPNSGVTARPFPGSPAAFDRPGRKEDPRNENQSTR